MIHSVAELKLEAAHGLFALESAERVELVNQIMKYKESHYPEPKRSWDPEEFKKRCYERSAIDQLGWLLKLNQDMSCYEILDEFMSEIEIPYESVDTPADVYEIISAVYDTLCDLQFFLRICNWNDI